MKPLKIVKDTPREKEEISYDANTGFATYDREKMKQFRQEQESQKAQQGEAPKAKGAQVPGNKKKGI